MIGETLTLETFVKSQTRFKIWKGQVIRGSSVVHKTPVPGNSLFSIVTQPVLSGVEGQSMGRQVSKFSYYHYMRKILNLKKKSIIFYISLPLPNHHIPMIV